MRAAAAAQGAARPIPHEGLRGLPPTTDERAILRLVWGEEQAKRGAAPAAPAPIPQQAVFDARAAMSHLMVAEAIENSIVALVCGTRDAAALDKDLGSWIEVGASPRASIALDRASRARAWLAGGDRVTPDNVRAVAPDVLRHPLILSYEATVARVTADAAVERRLAGRPASRIRGRGLSFEELRGCHPGDDVRLIGWRASARTGRAQMRVYAEERDRPTLLVVSLTVATFFGSVHATKTAVIAQSAALAGGSCHPIFSRISHIGQARRDGSHPGALPPAVDATLEAFGPRRHPAGRRHRTTPSAVLRTDGDQCSTASDRSILRASRGDASSALHSALTARRAVADATPCARSRIGRCSHRLARPCRRFGTI